MHALEGIRELGFDKGEVSQLSTSLEDFSSGIWSILKGTSESWDLEFRCCHVPLEHRCFVGSSWQAASGGEGHL